MNIINSTLPVRMQILEKKSYNRYIMLLNTKKIETKSMIELEVGEEYLAEVYEDKGVISFKNLLKKPKIRLFEEGIELIEKLLEIGDENAWYKNFIIQKLIESKSAYEFENYKEMFFAFFEGIYHIPFVYEGNRALFEAKKNGDILEVYLYFEIFGAMKIFIKEGRVIRIQTPFAKVAQFLSQYFKFELTNTLLPMFVFKRLMDIKG
ncbi:hypothetical protein [Campylobacter peloridis]|uniref:Uncharacterized protein n=1 Tax=Campylobacter peloridis TaxID=488546 RepID=A0ABX6TSJ1_9BACT|nr:hypothetical protein [Campylobacter peloridis]MBX1886388.1 hypothetical protein [Campylobacter peloridis]MBX2079267.1 hypothetical protein [Campylobacter peloridis]QOQ88932.1 hypothetical protein IMC75_00185 [Campylobacter peloridis]